MENILGKTNIDSGDAASWRKLQMAVLEETKELLVQVVGAFRNTTVETAEREVADGETAETAKSNSPFKFIG